MWSCRQQGMRRRLLAFVGAAALLCSGSGSGSGSCAWTCAVFTLQWPGGFCQSLANASMCRVPERVAWWTIHGLWPAEARACCGCWPMFLSDVQEIRDTLEERWPSLLKSRSSFHFWRDEWEKHGTCAACVEGLNSPLGYFRTCLKLRQRFDPHDALEAAGIRPSCDRPYKLSEVQAALVPLIGDQSEIQCVKDDKEREVWFQLKIPLSRNMSLGCRRGARLAGGGHPCPAQGPFYFLPIRRECPLRPCG